MKVEEAILIRLSDVHHTSGGQDRIPIPDKLNPLRPRLNPRDTAIVQPSLRSLLANHLATARHTDSQARSRLGADHNGVVDRIDGRLPVVGLLAGGRLEDGAVPHGARGLGAIQGGHGGGVAAVLVGGDEGGDEGLPGVVWPFVGVGVGEDFLGETFRPVVADVVALTSVVLQAVLVLGS